MDNAESLITTWAENIAYSELEQVDGIVAMIQTTLNVLGELPVCNCALSISCPYQGSLLTAVSFYFRLQPVLQPDYSRRYVRIGGD